jgi:TIR domain
MSYVFISYRRADAEMAASRIADDLSRILGDDAIFRDLDALKAGINYEAALEDALRSCAALVAVIGPQWAASGHDGRNRLKDPKDWVRLEISNAILRNIRIIPVLISGTSMPAEEQLPEQIKALSKRQAHTLDTQHWRQDIELLAALLLEIPGVNKAFRPSKLGRVVINGPWTIGDISVYVDKREVTRMKSKGTVSLDLEPGMHYLSVSSAIDTVLGYWSLTRFILRAPPDFAANVRPGVEINLKVESDDWTSGCYLVEMKK